MKHSDSLSRANRLYYQSYRPMLQLAPKVASILANAAFMAFLVLALSTPAWRIGPFTWWPVWQFPLPQEQPVQIGLLSLLPILCMLAWGGYRLARRQGGAHPRHDGTLCSPSQEGKGAQTKQWEATAMMLALLALSLVILRGLDLALSKRTIIQAIGLGLFWFSYLYILDRAPRLTFPLLMVIVVQGSVAVAQFGLQQDLGLAFLGELPLDPYLLGTSVLWSSDEVWLRGYGLTAHPNVLGAMLAVLLLLLLPQLRRRPRWQQAILAVGVAVGLLGLLVSFSRAGWLAFLGGLMYWIFVRSNMVAHGLRDGAAQALRVLKSFRTRRALWLPFLLVPVFLFLYHDLILSRWIYLDTAIEARSIQERLRDAEVAITLIGMHPWQGVGAGNGLDAAQAVRPDAGAVHNVPLLVTAELGILGGLCWLFLMAIPMLPTGFFDPLRRMSARVTHTLHKRYGRYQRHELHMYRPVWVGLLIAGLFDTPLWLTTSWRAALLLGVLAALQMQAIDSREKEV